MLNPVIMKMINGANSRMLARFTGQTIPQEARQATCSFDLVRAIRFRRFKWLGHILRAGPSRLIFQAVDEQHKMGVPGDILMDAPPHSCLVSFRSDCIDKTWRSLAKKVM